MAKKVFTTIFIVLFVPLAIVALILMNLRSTLLNSDFLKTGLVKANFYNQIASKVLTSFVKTDSADGSLGLGPVNKDQIVNLINQALPPSNLQTQIGTSLTNFNNFLAGKRNDLGVVINLGDAKKSLATQLTNTLQKDWDTLPICTDAQNSSDQLPTDCKPVGITAADEVNQLLYKSDGGIFNNVPDKLDAQNTWFKNLAIFNSARTIYYYVNLTAIVTLVAALVLFLIIILLNLKPILALFKNAGVALVIPSGLVLIGTLIFHLIFFTVAVANLKLGLPEELMPLNIALIKEIIGRYFVQTEIVSGVLVVLAITFLILANYFFKRSNNAGIVKADRAPRNIDSLPVRN